MHLNHADRRLLNDQSDTPTQAGREPALSPFTTYQGSVEPFRKPDHRAKRHARPALWADRQARRQRQAVEYAL